MDTATTQPANADFLDWKELQESLNIVERRHVFKRYQDLLRPRPKDENLRSAVEQLKRGTNKDTCHAILKVAIIFGHAGLKPRGREILVFCCPCPSDKHVSRFAFARIFLELYPDASGHRKDHSNTGTPATVTLITKKGRQQCQLASAFHLFRFALALLDAEVHFLQAQSPATGTLEHRTSRRALLEQFRSGVDSENPYIAQALHCHYDGDISGTVTHLNRGLSLSSMTKENDAKNISLEHAQSWNLRLSADEKNSALKVGLNGQALFIPITPAKRGCETIAKLFDEILTAYEKEVVYEARARNCVIAKINAERVRGVERPTPTPEEAKNKRHRKFQRCEAKRQPERSLRVQATMNAAFRVAKPPRRKKARASPATFAPRIEAALSAAAQETEPRTSPVPTTSRFAVSSSRTPAPNHRTSTSVERTPSPTTTTGANTAPGRVCPTPSPAPRRNLPHSKSLASDPLRKVRKTLLKLRKERRDWIKREPHPRMRRNGQLWEPTEVASRRRRT